MQGRGRGHCRRWLAGPVPTCHAGELQDPTSVGSEDKMKAGDAGSYHRARDQDPKSIEPHQMTSARFKIYKIFLKKSRGPDLRSFGSRKRYIIHDSQLLKKRWDLESRGSHEKNIKLQVSIIQVQNNTKTHRPIECQGRSRINYLTTEHT